MTSSEDFYAHLREELQAVREAGLYKSERIITTPQGAVVQTSDGREVINLCANNYLGLSSHPAVIEAAHEALRTHGYGLSSVRFICGTQDLHKTLEARLARFLGTEDTILYAAAFDANGGLFEPLLGEADAIISDELNHASIIDGIRLCKAQRWRYKHNDMADLERCLREAKAAGARFTLVFTDGVFSMDGTIAQLDQIREITDRYGALLGIDECHASGFMGRTGRGTHEYRDVFGKVDIITGTLGKALGGASGGFTSGRREVIELLRSDEGAQLRRKVRENGERFRSAMSASGFDLVPGQHPIIPVMLGDAELATRMADALLEEGIYVIGFSFPVVPKGKARIRTQMSAAHTAAQIDLAAAAFARVGRRLQAIR